MTARECRHNAEICLKLAQHTSEIYAKMALIELAKELLAMARHLERSSTRRPRRLPAQVQRRDQSLDGSP